MTETNVMQQEDEVQPCLADLTIGAMGNPKRGLIGYRDSKAARKSVHSFRQKMLNAHRFELTPELIHVVTLVASSLNTATLVTMAENARPCFDSMWIEWDEQVRRDASVAIQREVYGDDVHVPPRSLWANRVGYLIQNDATNRHWPGDKSSFLYTGMLLANAFDKDSTVPLSERAGPTNGIMASPLGYLFSNESPIQDRSSLGPLLDVLLFDVLLHDMPNEEPNKLAKEYLEALNSEEELVVEVKGGKSSVVKHLANQRPKTRGEILYGHQLCAFLSAINTGWVGQILQVEAGETPVRKDGAFEGEISLKGRRSEHNIRKVFEKFWSMPTQPADWMIKHDETLKENSLGLIADDLRFLITAMAMLNFTWISADPATRSDQKKIVNGKVIPRNEYRRLRIGLPPKEMDKKIRSVLSGRIPSRQHDVRGHFRKLSSGKRVWVHAHVRGDPSLGVIRKEYVLDKETEDRR